MKTSIEHHSPMQLIVYNALLQVLDPEVGENIVDLGLVYNIEVVENIAKVDLTMTTPACPMGEMLLDDIHATLSQMLPENLTFDINLVWEPPWEPNMMSAEAKQRLGWD